MKFFLDKIYELDLNDDQMIWREFTTMQIPVASASAFHHNGELVVVCGHLNSSPQVIDLSNRISNQLAGNWNNERIACTTVKIESRQEIFATGVYKG